MKQYLQAFQSINRSVKALLSDERNSVEIRESATSLKQSLLPCITEMRKSAQVFKLLVGVALDDLELAEDVWNSKSRIASASKLEIWDHLGKLSGDDINIAIQAEVYKEEAVEVIQQSWSEQIEHLRVKWFIDAKGQPKKGVGWGEKDGFIDDLRSEFEGLLETLFSTIQECLELLYQGINIKVLEKILVYIEFLNAQEKDKIHKDIFKFINDLKTSFADAKKHITTKSYHDNAKASVAALENKIWGDIRWEEVDKCEKEVSTMLEKIITGIIDDRVELASEAFSQAIAFYNNFLERQQRYQQESPEERLAEKAWIQQQRRELEQVTRELEEIKANASY